MTSFDKQTIDNAKAKITPEEHEKARKDIDALLEGHPDELKRVQENRIFAERFKKEIIAPKEAIVNVCGTSINLNAIIKKDLDKRSIYTVDNLCDMFLSWRIEQLVKYQKKKRAIDFNWAWLLVLLIIGIGGMLFFIIFLLPRIGGMM